MSVIEKAKSHFSNLCSTPSVIDVPEWDVKIYYTPLTLSERARIKRITGDNDMQMPANLLIVKAKNGTGEKLFTEEDRDTLYRQCDSTVIARIAAEIMNEADRQQKLEEIEKN
jgi:hypothetical protein